MNKQKRWNDAITYGVIGLGVIGFSIAVWHDSKIGSLVVFTIGAGLIAHATLGCYNTSCPDCGKSVPLETGENYTPCRHCHCYARATKTGLEALSPDFVADKPKFAIPFKDDLVLPDACSVCSKPPTRRTTLKVKMEDRRSYKTMAEGLKKNAMLGAGITPVIEVSVAVPHCDQHAHDAQIDMSEGQVAVFVRSYSYYRAASGRS